MNTPILIFILILQSFALYFAYLVAVRAVETQHRLRTTAQNRRIKRQNNLIKQLENRIAFMESRASKEPTKGNFPTINPFEASEARHAKEMKEIVEVNGVPVKKG